MKKLAAAMLLALGAAGAQAAPYSLGTLGTASGTYNVTGTFEDIFNFTISSPNNLFTSIVQNLPKKEVGDVIVTIYDIENLAASLYGGFDASGTALGYSSGMLSAGNYSLKITGTGIGAGVGTDGSAGQYSLFTQAVPEPESYAMFLAGLGLMGAIARRRRVQ